MLTKRLIAAILLRDGRAVKSKQFKDYRDVGDPVSQARIFYANGIDELCILNTQSDLGIQPLLDVLPRISECCYIPVTAGGGIRSVDDAAKLIEAGCEKLVVGNRGGAREIAERFGKQAVVQCLDFNERELLTCSPYCGEVIVQNIDRDGMMNGYGEHFLDVDVPVVRLGGCGNYQHMLDAFNAGADACAAGSLWSFTDSNPLRAKRWLANHGVKVRGSA